MLLLPHQGDKDIGSTKSLKRNFRKHLLDNVKTQVTFPGQKLSTQFDVKDRTKFEHKHDVIYLGKCPEQTCTGNCLGESAGRITERHSDRNEKCNLFRHAVVNDHRNASYDDFKIIGSRFRNNTFERKFAKALLIKELRPTFNVQEKLFELKLFN